MKYLCFALLCLLIAAPLPAATTNRVADIASAGVATPDSNDPVEKEFQKLMADDDDAQAEVDKWIQSNQVANAQGTGIPKPDLNRRIRARFEPVRKGYASFIERYPEHARARIAFASFLDDLGEEQEEQVQLEKARELDPKNPAVWNQLANYYGHNGDVTNAFAYYAKAIDLDPTEPVYYHNLGTTVYLFRKDAMDYYRITEQQVFDKVLELYAKALKLAPDDFPLASDVAQTYYGIKPMRTEAALRAWTNTLAIAHDEVEREGVYLHLARIKLAAGRFDEAHAHLNAVTNDMYETLKQRLTRNLAEQERKAHETNAPSTPEKK